MSNLSLSRFLFFHSKDVLTRTIFNDPFIDFIKGVAIMMVILLHSIPGYILYDLFSIFWLDQAVLLFILLQAYHIKNSFVYKQRKIGYFFSGYSFLKMGRKIILPFAVVLSIQMFLFYISGDWDFDRFLYAGGIGPGSYYLYIYLQIAFLAPVMYYWMRNCTVIVKFFVFIFLAETLELLSSYWEVPEYAYRLLFFRYFFLIYLGFSLDLGKIKLNRKKLVLVIISIIFLWIDCYTSVNLEPFIFNTAWKGCHWLAYFYTAYFFVYLLKVIYCKLPQNILEFLFLLGRYSWMIFLLQMFVFSFDFVHLLKLEDYKYFILLVLFPVKIIFSIAPVIYLYYHRKSIDCEIVPKCKM